MKNVNTETAVKFIVPVLILILFSIMFYLNGFRKF